MVQEYPADAWIILASSEPVLRWLSESSLPAFALFGRLHGLRISGIKPHNHHSHFDWCDPAVLHFSWSHRSTAHQFVRWLQKPGRGKQSFRQTIVLTAFSEGNLKDFSLTRSS